MLQKEQLYILYDKRSHLIDKPVSICTNSLMLFCRKWAAIILSKRLKIGSGSPRRSNNFRSSRKNPDAIGSRSTTLLNTKHTVCVTIVMSIGTLHIFIMKIFASRYKILKLFNRKSKEKTENIMLTHILGTRLMVSIRCWQIYNRLVSVVWRFGRTLFFDTATWPEYKGSL